TTFKRMNTIFKTWAGAWPLLVIGTALLLPLALSTRRLRATIRWTMAAALVASLFHPVALALGRARSASPRGLDGLAWLSRECGGLRRGVRRPRADRYRERPADAPRLGGARGGLARRRGRRGDRRPASRPEDDLHLARRRAGRGGPEDARREVRRRRTARAEGLR